ncbi:hypothetical protein [Parasporobacterium paucivorans]|uniref:Uncharacterized protein n=1 Tax=Parasporobacterium paucivorans DSM 15970 TaxID=1122934 RepID=A0A1M6J6W2_9FIRM|nr:hypothetical protein [Parasporobacterium paucivorans]SHJ42421.1 hypothetical protein SAMN02745691_01921 [Parasporobacterium paucivorans DSM 15970]
MKYDFLYNVQLVPLLVENCSPEEFRERLIDIPYLMYEVETTESGHIIAVNKPGGKKNYGRFSKNDLMVFVLNRESPAQIVLLSHKEIYNDIVLKKEKNPDVFDSLI